MWSLRCNSRTFADADVPHLAPAPPEHQVQRWLRTHLEAVAAEALAAAPATSA
ncbi:MAG TPA: hypothetical protein VIW70_17390 [Rubrivivax sp.]